MNTKTPVITVVIILVILIGGLLIYYSGDRQAEPLPTPGSDANTTGAIVEAFRDEVTTRAIENMGGAIPIEGFDADLLMSAYEGTILPQDFDGVRSFEGIYRYANGELEYSRTSDGPVSSAERTVSDEGYGTLLKNISQRLGVEAEDVEDAIEIVDRLDGV